MYQCNPWISYYPQYNMPYPYYVCNNPYYLLEAGAWQVGDIAFINVSVATLWGSPEKPRSGIDDLAISNPVNMWRWARSLSIEERKDLSANSRVDTQGLFGNKVTISEVQGSWVKVLLQGQPTPRNSIGYPGWVPAIQLIYTPEFNESTSDPFVLVIQSTATLFKSRYLNDAVMDISYNTRLPIKGEFGNLSYQVLLPNGETAWIFKKDVRAFSQPGDIPRPTGEDIVNSAEKFLGLPYLWGGTSGWGYDCSGLTFSMYDSHGITISRDSGPQSKEGMPVDLSNLQVGDLIFFSRNKGQGNVYHVGIYMGEGMMIHAPNSTKTVEIVELQNSPLFEDYSSARRYLN